MKKRGEMCRHFTEEQAVEVIRYLDSIGMNYTIRNLKSPTNKYLNVSITVKATLEEQRELSKIYEKIREP